MMRVLQAVIICFMCTAPQTQAQDVSAADPASIVNALKAWGSSATLDMPEITEPVIDSEIDGIPYAIYFYDCDNANANCGSISFEVVATLRDGFSAERANAWNSENRFAYCYLGNDGTAVLVYDVNLSGGVSAQNFESTLNLWRHALSDFKDRDNW